MIAQADGSPKGGNAAGGAVEDDSPVGQQADAPQTNPGDPHVSQEAREAADDLWRDKKLYGTGKAPDWFTQAFARFERETLERAAKVAEGEKYGERVTQATYNEGNDTLSYYNEACDDIAQAIRSLTDRK